ncbi:CbbY [Achromatium sp. WMS1]|nr:CbbY [Achromatium sp. WMS1]
MLKALLFDVDGTLADNERDGHRVAFNKAFAEFDLDWCWSTELYSHLLAITGGKERLYHFINNWHPLIPEVINLDDFINKLHQHKTTLYNAIIQRGGIKLRPGILRLLHQAYDMAGLKLAIVTTTSLENVLTLLRVNIGDEALDWFEVIAAGSQVTAKKPAPDIYQYALQKLDVEPSACIAFEDSAIGLRAAKAADIANVVITTTDYTRNQDFTGAALVLESLGDADTPCRQIAGHLRAPEQIDLAFIRQLHEASI